MLGGTLTRSEINPLPNGFVKTSVVMILFRLMILPIISVAWGDKLRTMNRLKMRIDQFVINLTWVMLNAAA